MGMQAFGIGNRLDRVAYRFETFTGDHLYRGSLAEMLDIEP
jgi:hypothetical protein